MTTFLLFFCLFCLFPFLITLLIIIKRKWNPVSAEQINSTLQSSVADIQHKLSQFLELSHRVTDLDNILRSPKLRGNRGEIWLEGMLGQVLAKPQFSTNYRFKDGSTCDAVIFLRNNLLLPIDSKFSLENFRKIGEAKDPEEADRISKVFYSDIKRRIDEVSSKYIHQDENTLNFAFMFIPAESVYYYAFIEDKDENGLLQYAFNKKVVPVSPSSLYPYLEIVLFGLQGLRIEQESHKIQQGLLALHKELVSFDKDYRKAQTQLQNAQRNFDDIERRLTSTLNKILILSGSNGSDSIQENSLTSQE